MRHLRLIALLGLAAGGAPAASVNAAPEGLKLAFPLACRIGQTCEIQTYVDRDPGPGVKDYRCGSHTYQGHDGVDIRLPSMVAQRAGVDVLAAAAGRVSRLRDGVADISVRAPGAPSVANQECGNGLVIDHGGGWQTQYCHLAKGSLKVKSGDQVAAGQPIGRVGLSGNTEYPHLHLTVRKSGTAVDPFAPAAPAGSCNSAASSTQSLWLPAVAKALSYKSGAVLNYGFAGAAVSPTAVEEGQVVPAGKSAAVVVAYVRSIDLDEGNIQALTITGPDGAVLAQSKLPPLTGGKAEYLMFVGKKRPAAGWTPGTYRATYTITQGGKIALSKSFQIQL